MPVQALAGRVADGQGPVSRDHYAILGVTPASEDVVIRAAYRALMRRYHPDADPSSEASKRAQEINAAYAVLSDPDKRARYDGSLAAQGLIKPEPKMNGSIVRRLVPGPAAVGLVALAATAVFLYASPPAGVLSPDQSSGETLPDEAAPRPQAATAAAPNTGCADEGVSPLLRAELFRRAAAVSGADRERVMNGSDRAVVRLDSAKEAGDVGCNALVAIDLPPGLVVEGGRTNLNAEIGYQLAGSGNDLRLTGLSGAGSLVRSLATLALLPAEPEDLDFNPSDRVASAEPVRAGATSVPKPTAKSVAASSPRRMVAGRGIAPAQTASCSLGEGWAERTVCGNGNLTALDRQLGLLYGQSLTRADESRRAVLLASHERFEQRRSACRSEPCLTSTYVARLREISDIMARKASR